MERECSKLYTREELIAQRQGWKAEGKKVVFTNGCYDILHPGHIRFSSALARWAMSLSWLLIPMRAFSASRGHRALFRRAYRANWPYISRRWMQSLFSVKILLGNWSPTLLPDVLVKGADWAHFIAGREEVEAAGGQVHALSLEPGFSTTDIAEKIINRRSPDLNTASAVHTQ